MSTRKARKERRREQVREEILEASREVLLKNGVRGLTLSAIARRLQLTKAALYHYFPSKEAIVFELVRHGLIRQAETVTAAVERAGSGADAIAALMTTLASYFGEHKDELRLIFLVPQVGIGVRFTAEMFEAIRPLNEPIFGLTAAKIRADQDTGLVCPDLDARRFTFAAYNAIVGVMTLEGFLDVVDGAPLVHARNALVSDLVESFRARLAAPARSTRGR